MKRSKHVLNHHRLATTNQGVLYPVGCIEVLPGDSFRHKTQMLIRLSPLVAPVMHPMHAHIVHFYVPNRIVWTGWEEFITRSDLDDPLPTFDVMGNSGSVVPLAQALGIGVDPGNPALQVNALPFRAYNLIYNEFFRDQDLTTPLTVPTGDTDNPSYYTLRNVSWQKDYFTTARAYPQLGAGDAIIGFEPGTTAPVSGQIGVRRTGDNADITLQAANAAGNPVTRGNAGSGAATQANINFTLQNAQADLGAVQGAGISINEWRKAMAHQRVREARNRFGSRYTDLLAFYGVRGLDSRLQRPEYLGGGRQVISLSEVLSTADTEGAVVGDLAGHGIAGLRNRPYSHFFPEHGYVISLLYVRPVTMYQDAVPRTYLRRTWDDFWQKELEMMGEQGISNAEIYAKSAQPNDIFGYSPRHDDYRFMFSTVSGEFRSTLDYWHMARQFDTQPVLNGSFVQANPTDRIYAETISDELQVMCYHSISARRLVSHRAKH